MSNAIPLPANAFDVHSTFAAEFFRGLRAIGANPTLREQPDKKLSLGIHVLDDPSEDDRTIERWLFEWERNGEEDRKKQWAYCRRR